MHITSLAVSIFLFLYIQVVLRGQLSPKEPIHWRIGGSHGQKIPSIDVNRCLGRLGLGARNLGWLFTYIWAIFEVNVGQYSIHGASGYGGF